MNPTVDGNWPTAAKVNNRSCLNVITNAVRFGTAIRIVNMAQNNEKQRRWLFTSEKWWNSYQVPINADPGMTLHGRETFDENIVIGIDDEHYRGLGIEANR